MSNRAYLRDDGDYGCATCDEAYDNIYSAMACYDSHLRVRRVQVDDEPEPRDPSEGLEHDERHPEPRSST